MRKERENWMQKLDNQKDEMFEKKLNRDLEKAFIQLEGILSSSYGDDTAELKAILEKIVDIYYDMKRECFDFDEEDFKYYKAKLEQLINLEKYKTLEENHKNSDEYQSWEDFRKEESLAERNENKEDKGILEDDGSKEENCFEDCMGEDNKNREEDDEVR